ncbi:MAG: TolC family protein [Agriterribacter sp.]
MQNVKSLLVGMVVMVVSLKSIAQADTSNAAVLTLKQCVDKALDNNIPVKQQGLQSDKAKADWQQAKANLLPNVNGSWGYGWNQGRSINPYSNEYLNQHFSSSSVGLSAGVTLFSGLQLQNLIRQTGYAFHASEMEWQQSKDELTLRVILQYLTVLNNEDTWHIMTEQVEVTKKQVERMSVLVEKGVNGSYMLSDLKGQLANDEISIIAAYNALQTAKLDLSQLMNMPYDKNMKLERMSEAELLEVYPAGAEQVYAAAIENLAQIKAIDLRTKSAEKNVQIAKGAYYPTLSLGGSLSSNYSNVSNSLIPTTVTTVETGGYVTIDNVKNPVMIDQQNYDQQKISYNNQIKNNVGTYVGLNLSIPIFNNLRVTTAVKKAKLNAKSAAYDAAQNRLVLKQSIEKAHQDMISAYEKYKVLLEQVTQYKESFRSAEIRFNLGTIVSTEYLITKNNYDRARLNLTQTWYEYIFRTRILDFYQGKLSL